MILNQFRYSPIILLTTCHIFLLTLSNILVQYPFELCGYHTTWGALPYPAVFILSDLTVRIYNATTARKIIILSMLPALVISYIIASALENGAVPNEHSLFVIHLIPLRIACASFVAYTVGQLLDIYVFQRYRTNSSWWLAPSVSTTVGNLIDTLLFFSIAFYHSSNLFLNQYWPEIAIVDMLFKIAISLFAFIPLYGLALNIFSANYSNKSVA